MSRKQITRGGLAAPQILASAAPPPLSARAHELRTLGAQFLRIVAHLPCRPEPRHAWDNRARRDQRVPHPNDDGIQLSRAALVGAYRTGSVDAIRGTRHEIEEYWDLCKAAALAVPAQALTPSRLPLGAPTSSHAHLALIKEQSEATVAVAVAQADPNETTIAQMRREVREAIAAGCELLGIRVPFSAQQHQQHQQVS